MKGKTKTSTTGKSSDRGYTLIELIVVIILLGIVFALAVPAIRHNLPGDSLNTATRRLIGAARELRTDAVREQVDYTLHLDLDGGAWWVSSTDMTPEKRDEMQERASRLPGDVRIAGVSYSVVEKKTEGEATITFFRRGYVEPAVVHLAEGEQLSHIVFQPFGKAIQVYGGYEGEEADGGKGVYAGFR